MQWTLVDDPLKGPLKECKNCRPLELPSQSADPDMGWYAIVAFDCAAIWDDELDPFNDIPFSLGLNAERCTDSFSRDARSTPRLLRSFAIPSF
jgi:hypothetical protein